MIARLKRLERPATMPSGIPTSSESATATSISASVCMLSSHSPVSANEAKAQSVTSAARKPPKRRTRSVAGGGRPDPRQPEQQPVEPVDEVVDGGREPVEEREDDPRVLLAALGRGARSGTRRGGSESAFQTSELGHGYSSSQSR